MHISGASSPQTLPTSPAGTHQQQQQEQQEQQEQLAQHGLQDLPAPVVLTPQSYSDTTCLPSLRDRYQVCVWLYHTRVCVCVCVCACVTWSVPGIGAHTSQFSVLHQVCSKILVLHLGRCESKYITVVCDAIRRTFLATLSCQLWAVDQSTFYTLYGLQAV